VDTQLKHRINAGRVAVKSQSGFFHDQFGRVESEWKEDDTRVTFADFAISERVSAELRKSFPEDDFCSEESSPQDEVLPLRSRFTWILDPIDGTNNYAIGIPVCAISLALLKDGVPVYGFVYDMSRRVLIEGGPGIGVFDGRSGRSVVQENLNSESLIGMHFPTGEVDCAWLTPLLAKHHIRSIGSGALIGAFTAVGILDGAIDFKVKVWDIAAFHALILAGGGEFHFFGEPLFPLREFHVSQASCPYFAGTPSFCRYIEELRAAG
jgi:myo-inositol-1(or 4)-monophosphatase